jgi:hypothetical protein
MEKFMEWFGRNRKTIGYTIGGLNLFNGLLSIVFGSFVTGLFWAVLGAALIIDAKYYK